VKPNVPNIVFTTRLTEADWDDTVRCWRCPPLAVPGAMVEALYVEGTRIDSARYEVLREQSLIRWMSADQPQRVAATIRLTEDLTLGTETDRWKKLAIILPVIATIMSAAIAGGATYLSKAIPEGRSPSRQITNSSAIPIAPAASLQDSTAADDTDNTHISKARTLAFGEAGTGITARSYQQWFRFFLGSPAPKVVHVITRNLTSSGGLTVRVLDAVEAELKSQNAFQANVVMELPSLRPGVYYIAVGPSITPDASFEVVITAE